VGAEQDCRLERGIRNRFLDAAGIQLHSCAFCCSS
jgi:hypothetical protein